MGVVAIATRERGNSIKTGLVDSEWGRAMARLHVGSHSCISGLLAKVPRGVLLRNSGMLYHRLPRGLKPDCAESTSGLVGDQEQCFSA